MNVLVTGAGGNIGTAVVEQLVEHGHHVRALVLPEQVQQVARRFLKQIEIVAGDVRNSELMHQVVAGQDSVVHLAAILPPQSDTLPDHTRSVNIGGTHTLIQACQAQAHPPRLLFASTFDLFGHTNHLKPPRTIDDPVVATDVYTETKLQGEQLVQASGLPWCILRFADVPLLGFRDAHPIMFEIPLDQRFEVLHPRDAALAVVNALAMPVAWNQVWLIGGGPQCQMTYGEYLAAMLGAMGIEPLPTECFTTNPYCTDWLDTTTSQELLHYQQHSFAQIVAEIQQLAGWRRQVARMLGPRLRRDIIRLSPYAREHNAVGS